MTTPPPDKQPAAETLLVKVRKQHVLNGRRCSRHYCPIALAIKEMLPGSKVVVQLDVINIDGVEYATPERAMLFMYRYDQSKNIPGTSFKLPKACPTCKHPQHVRGQCGTLIHSGTEREHACPCGKC